MSAELISYFFLFALFLNLTIEVILSIRNQKHIKLNKHTVPTDFSDTVPIEAHKKAADYSIAKLKLHRLILFFDLAIIIFMTLGGGFQDIYNFWLSQQIPTMLQNIGFIVSTLLILTLLHIPFSIFSTFKIEEEFGFNKMTPVKMLTDTLKQLVIALVLGVPLLWVILSLMDSFFNQAWWLYTWITWMAFNLFILWAYPKWIAPLFNKFTPLEESEMKQRIESLLHRCGFESNGIFVMDGSSRSGHGNAYFTGMGKNKRIVFYDTLIETLEPEEVEAVLAHELGHFKHGHIRKQLILSSIISLLGLYLLNWLAHQPEFFAGLGMISTTPTAALLLFITAVPAFFFFLAPFFAIKSRKNEFEADSFAAKHSNAEALISALLKMYRDNASTLTPDPLYSAYHDSHPPAKIRIEHLRSL